MQKPFSFYLSAFALITLLAFGLNACTRNPGLQGKGEAILQGEWQQDSVPKEKLLTEYSLYNIKFSCDSFFIQIRNFSKVNNGPDTCTRSGRWTEYVKGNYEQRNDTLHVKGQYCNRDYTIKDPGGCFQSGIYEEYFKLKKHNDSLLEFDGASSLQPIIARLVKRSTCNPKPL